MSPMIRIQEMRMKISATQKSEHLRATPRRLTLDEAVTLAPAMMRGGA
jgi:hypothetical protein